MNLHEAMSEPILAPEACTLPTVERPLRVAEFDEMFGAATAAERLASTTLQLTLPPGPAVAVQAAGLVAREVECCNFYTFTLTIRSDSLRLRVEAPVEHEDVLDAMAGRVQAARER
jgi:hypothetical protein